MAEPFECPGCHGGDIPDFDHYMDVLDIPADRAPDAFAAWLAGTTDWQGTYAPITDGSTPDPEGAQ